MDPATIERASPLDAASSAPIANANATATTAGPTEPSDALPRETDDPQPVSASAASDNAVAMAAAELEANALPPSVDRGDEQPSAAKFYAPRIVS